MNQSLVRAFGVPAACAAMLSLGGCAVTGSGKTVLSASAAGSDLVQAGNGVSMAVAIYETTPNPSVAVVADGKRAAAALVAFGAALRDSTATSGDLRQDVALAEAAVQAAIDGASVASPAMAQRLVGYRDMVAAALGIYNADAAGAGLPQVPLPAAATPARVVAG